MIPKRSVTQTGTAECEMTSLEDLQVDTRILAAARALRLKSFESVLCLSGPVGALSQSDVDVLKTAIAKQLVQPSVTALQLAGQCKDNSLSLKKLTTGCEVLDQALRGGILSRGITEISGESASGKTQFALQLSLTAQLPESSGGLDGGTIYICTEDAFPSKRLYQMIQNFNRRHGNQLCTSGNLGDKIYIEHIADYDGLLGCVTKKVPVLLSSGSVKLVIVDSIAAHFRSDYEGHEMYKRAKHIGSIGTTLHQFSQQYNIPVVCINQVTSSMKDEGRQLVPSLGLSWSSHVTTRIMLSRTNQTVTVQQDSVHGPLETVVREMEIVFAPHLPTMTVPYIIDHEGMKGFK